MIICEDQKFIFIRNPKTASRSLSQFFLFNFNCFEILSYHAIKIPREYKNFNVYLTVRNPYSRAVSIWKHLVHHRKHNFVNYKLDFLEYLSNKVFIVGDNDCNFNFFYQIDLLKTFSSCKILYFEKLKQSIKKHFSVEKKINKIGESSFDWRSCYKDNYTKIYATNFLKKDIDSIGFYNKIY